MTSSTSVSLKIVVLVRDAEPACARSLDRVDCDVPEPRVVADIVVDLAHAVEMDDERHARRRLEPVENLLEAQRVRAQLDGLRVRRSLPAATSSMPL